jgi:hypothetical protein
MFELAVTFGKMLPDFVMEIAVARRKVREQQGMWHPEGCVNFRPG